MSDAGIIEDKIVCFNELERWQNEERERKKNGTRNEKLCRELKSILTLNHHLEYPTNFSDT